MKRRDLEKHLKQHGCAFAHHGGSHDHWVNLNNKKFATVPRHREIPAGTVTAICRELTIPKPQGKK